MRSGQQAALGSDLAALLGVLGLKAPILAGYDWGGLASCVVPSPDIQELPDARLRDQEVHRPGQERPLARTAARISGYAATARSAAKCPCRPASSRRFGA